MRLINQLQSSPPWDERPVDEACDVRRMALLDERRITTAMPIPHLVHLPQLKVWVPPHPHNDGAD